MTELQAFLVASIASFVAESPLNRLKEIDGSPMWEEPLVGFADGDDELYARYKTIVGDFHLTPREALTAHPRSAGVRAPHVAVVSWILPTAAETRRSNALMTQGPSVRWNHGRFHGEEFNDALRRHVVALLEERGHLAVAPMLSPQFRQFEVANGMTSTWSERHTAYAAGLGTFGLSDGLITARGVAHRCGSVVFDAECVPSARPYHYYQEYCLSRAEGTCGECIQRCPAGAITLQGHDKRKCRDYMRRNLADWLTRPGYVGSYVACGLCQTGVPCESQIPERTTG